MNRYNPSQIETKWQTSWKASGLYRAKDFSEQPKFMMLTEFPYPSGDGLHLGHTREYTLGDILARFKRMQGYNVMFPMGYDAFGLPTENYAIKNKIAPQLATEKNIANFQKQFESLGLSIDWSRSVNTTDPKYYKWTQWLFLQFFKQGLAYQDDISINWCPKCKTGLANEEVSDGRHERCDTPVEKKRLIQWMLRITDYADKLIEGLKEVDYPSRIADQQINWIGRSVGAEIDFRVDARQDKITVFTTRPDTIFGSTFLVLAPEHPLVEQIVADDYRQLVSDYIHQAQVKSEIERQDMSREKTGVFIGAHAVHPLTGAKLPIWIADYVLTGYGTGAIMAVPGHDERDGEFATKFNLPIVEVITKPSDFEGQFYTGSGKMINSGEFDGLDCEVGKQQIIDKLESLGLGAKKVNFRLRDWIFSRQHYWGEPIPIVHCPKCGTVPVPDKDLPVVLPKVENYEPTDTGESPLAVISDWVNVKCPVCGTDAKRETDTMPNWAGSSWYYLRYMDPDNNQAFAAQDKLKYWGEVDMYLGGMEHTTLHLLYSRFWHKFFYDIGLVPTSEPYAARRGQGIVLAADGTKMSKSKGNVVNPSEIIDSGYGADSLRVLIAFLAPYDMTTAWQPDGVPGTYRFLNRVWNLSQEFINQPIAGGAVPDSIIHKTIKKVTDDVNSMNFNTAVASLMEYVNQLYKLKVEGMTGSNWQLAIESLIKMIAPFAPHLAEEIWSQLGNTDSVHFSLWPEYNESKMIDNRVRIAVQVNSKVRAEIEIATDESEDQVKKTVLAIENVQKYITGKQIVKTIYIPNRIVNIVVK